MRWVWPALQPCSARPPGRTEILPGPQAVSLSGMANEDLDLMAEGTWRDISEVVEAARAMVGEQFQIAERLDRKARYQVATAGAFFAVVQAIAVNAITNASLSDGWIATLAAAAVPAALLTIGALITAASAWRTQIEADLPIADLRELTDRLQRGDDQALRDLAHHYLNLVDDRRAKNVTR